MIDRLRLVQPNLDTKPGSVSRDLFIDLQADELQKLYNLVSLVSDKQSFATASGSDLDKLARNFGFSRKRGATASGTVVFSLDEVSIDHEIAEGTIVSTRSGISYRTIGNYRFLANQKNIYSANAARIQKQLNVAGSATGFALEVPVEAVSPGFSGNIGSYQIISQSAPFNFSVTNISSMSGGSDQESDSEFRRRFLSSFSAAGVGTSSGYSNGILSLNDVLDVLVVEPGNTLMLRDGTEIIEGDFNLRRISSSGTGGKVDIYVLGTNNEEISESFVFFNKSPDGDISNDANDYVLGNFEQDSSLTSQERRVESFKTGNIPFQPVSSIVSISGEDSGPLTEGETFELVKDYNSDTGGSPFGFDKIKFLNNYKTVSEEAIVKSAFGSQDPLEFSDVTVSSSIFEDVSIESENSSVNISDRSFIILNHMRVKNVSRVFNRTTGETYAIEDMFLENGINDTGVIKISGNKLPATTDKLEVDYIWNKEYDEVLDYSVDSSTISWKDSFSKEGYRSFSRENSYFIELEDNVLDVENVYIYRKEFSIVGVQGGTHYCDLTTSISNVYSVRINGVDVLNTKEKDYSFSGTRLFFSSDSGAKEGESCEVIYNYDEVFSFDQISGFYQENKIFLPDDGLFPSQKLGRLNEFFSSNQDPIVKYYVFAENIIPQVSLSTLPLSSSSQNYRFFNSSQNNISGSHKTSEFSSRYERYSPSKARVNAESIVSEGSIKIFGTTIKKHIIETEVSRIFNGQIFDLSNFVDGDGIAKVASVKVNKDANIHGYRLSNYRFSDDALEDSTLSKFQFYLANNIYNSFSYSDGDMAEIVIYTYKESDSETLYFYEDSSIETEKVFLNINSISVNSGFLNSGSISGNISVDFGNQPATGEEYLATYRFVAPKEGERLFVSYNHNKVISDSTKIIEESRPITADVLVKEASLLNVNVNASIVISDTFIDDSNVIRENVIDQISNLLSTNTLGGIIDYSDVIRAITNVTGVESADVSLFNYDSEVGRRDFVKALDNQSIVPNVISVSVVSRKDFRIS